MIGALFLVSAMSMPMLASNHPILPAKHATSFARFMRAERKVLIVGGSPGVIAVFRAQGLQAFGALTEDGPAGRYHAIGNAGFLPFLSYTFQSVYWNAPNPARDPFFFELVDVLRLIEPGGLFLFDDEINQSWPVWMKGRGWARVPWRVGRYSVWERMYNGDHHRTGGVRGHGREFKSSA